MAGYSEKDPKHAPKVSIDPKAGRIRPTGENPLQGEAVRPTKLAWGSGAIGRATGTTQRFGTKVSGGHFRRSGYLRRILIR